MTNRFVFKHNRLLLTSKNNKRHPEPAFIKQENVHIAETISEIRPILKAEHKGTDPEFASKIVFYRKYR